KSVLSVLTVLRRPAGTKQETEPMKPPEFLIELRGEPGWNVPTEARLKRFLKQAIRSFGLRCVSIREAGGAIDPQPEGGTAAGDPQRENRTDDQAIDPNTN